MRASSASVQDLVAGLLPLVLIGWALHSLFGATTSIAGLALLPTIVSLSLIGLFFGIRLAVKQIRRSSRPGDLADADFVQAKESSAATQGFDADAAFANYMRNRDTASPPLNATDAASEDSGPFTPRPGGFGRKGV